MKLSERLSWYFYDWANSAFSTTVATVFLGPYITELAKQHAVDGLIDVLGFKIAAGSFFPYVISLSVFLQVFLLPIIGALADYSHRKKQLLLTFAYLGALATMALYFVTSDTYLLGGLLFIIANISFGASVVLYNAYLPDIAEEKERDEVSSRGWAFGYIGGGILLALNLAFVSFADQLGLTIGNAIRISLASAGIWWAIFTLIPAFGLKIRGAAKAIPEGKNYLAVSMQQLIHTFKHLPSYPQTLLFLIAYLLYNDAIQTVIVIAAQFGSQELGLSIGILTGVILMVQFVAFTGALIFNFLAKKFGNKHAIMISLVIWIGAVLYAYGLLYTASGFIFLGVIMGLVLGGSQALSRSLFSLMIPSGKESEYFSIYEISERGTSWLGPLLFGLVFQFTGNYRLALLSLITFFVIGLILLFKVDTKRAIHEAGNTAPLTAK